MRPPICCLCDRGFEEGEECEWVSFRQTDSDKQWHADAAAQRIRPDHPPDCDWFCRDHAETARAFAHEDRATAIHSIQKYERWQLIDIDLFDRDTPPMVGASGLGFESGFCAFWDRVLATIDTNGTTYPTNYRLSFVDAPPDYALDHGGPELLAIKKFLADRDGAAQRRLAIAQAREMRARGHRGISHWLTKMCAQIGEEKEPDLW